MKGGWHRLDCARVGDQLFGMYEEEEAGLGNSKEGCNLARRYGVSDLQGVGTYPTKKLIKKLGDLPSDQEDGVAAR